MKNKTAIVTGASSGIGRALAILLAKRGYAICIVGRKGSLLQETVDQIQMEGGKAVPILADVRLLEETNKVVLKTVEQFGSIDLLINNAGIGHYHLFSEMPPEAYEEVIGTNFIGVLHMTHAVLPYFQRQRSGSIINIASTGAIAGVPGRSIYCATKAAIRNWSRALSMELQPEKIQVLCVLPGSTETRFYENLLGKPPTHHGNPGKVMSPPEVAEKTLRALEEGRLELILTTVGNILEWMNRVSPRTVDRLINWQNNRQLASEQIS